MPKESQPPSRQGERGDNRPYVVVRAPRSLRNRPNRDGWEPAEMALARERQSRGARLRPRSAQEREERAAAIQAENAMAVLVAAADPNAEVDEGDNEPAAMEIVAAAVEVVAAAVEAVAAEEPVAPPPPAIDGHQAPVENAVPAPEPNQLAPTLDGVVQARPDNGAPTCGDASDDVINTTSIGLDVAGISGAPVDLPISVIPSTESSVETSNLDSDPEGA